MFVALLVMPGQAQTYQLIYTFDTTTPNPCDPAAGVSIHAAGNYTGRRFAAAAEAIVRLLEDVALCSS